LADDNRTENRGAMPRRKFTEILIAVPLLGPFASFPSMVAK